MPKPCPLLKTRKFRWCFKEIYRGLGLRRKSIQAQCLRKVSISESIVCRVQGNSTFYIGKYGLLAQRGKRSEKGMAFSRAWLPTYFRNTFMKNILIFGDSLTAGYGLPAAQAYPSLIQEQLRQEGYADYKVLNGGLSGDTTAGGVHRIERWLHEPIDIFILALGANDGLRGIAARETSQNLQAILDKVLHKNPEAKVILSGMEIPDIVPGRYAAEFRKLFRELALKNNIHFIPFLLEGVAGNRLLNLPDGVHPNAEGQKLLAQHTWNKLKELL